MQYNLKTFTRLLALFLVLVLALSSCDLSKIFGSGNETTGTTTTITTPASTTTTNKGNDGSTTTTTTTSTTTSTTKPVESTTTSTTTTGKDEPAPDPKDEFDFSMIPEYSPEIAPDGYVVVNGNVPFFGDLPSVVPECFEVYGELDNLGRCTYAYACLGKDLLPTDDRGSISSVTPTGWHSVTYPETGNQSLYNRTHLIGWALAGENANKQNLITGTTYMNQHTMQIFENQLLSYVKGNDTHVLYQVTPVFEGDNLVCTGVLMEAYSVEDHGEDIMFCVFVYNVQEGIIIDYATGESERENPGEDVGSTDFNGTIYDFSKFDGTGTVTQYIESRTSSDGWIMTWGRIDEQEWIGKDVPQVILNGKTSAVGTITSAKISGGISEFYMNYGLSFKDTKIKFTVDIMQNGKVVASKTVENLSAEQSAAYELHWILDEAIEGDFVIRVTNKCPSNTSNSHKDRLSIWNFGWK